MSKTVADKLAAIEQKKARLAEQEAKAKTAARKAANKRKFEIGGLAIKAGLGEFDANVLLGAFMSIAEQASNAANVSTWQLRGGQAFDRDRPSTGCIVKFEVDPPAAVAKSLRGIGLRWNRLRREWEGFADAVSVSAIAEPAGGVVSVIATDKTGG